MSKFPDALWLNVSPALQRFDRPLLNTLAEQLSIAQWQYYQTVDEPTSLDIALTLLHDYLKTCDRPLHLVGHSTGGLLGLLYARRYPERVRSLTLLSVGVHPAVDWQAHYYVQRQMLLVSREIVLTQTVYNLFGCQCPGMTQKLTQTLKQDLISSLSPHSLYQRVSIPPGGVSVPMLVCGSQNDVAIDSNLLLGWQPWLKPSDRLWQCSNGRYFFHYFYPQQVSEQLVDFWNSLSLHPQLSFTRN
jgi:pimeloyl-ACP methyl ester carboxylesterase